MLISPLHKFPHKKSFPEGRDGWSAAIRMRFKTDRIGTTFRDQISFF
jgi:hypothetical protein